MEKKRKKDAWWVIRQIEKCLPLSYDGSCECSANLVYYLDKIKKKLKGL